MELFETVLEVNEPIILDVFVLSGLVVNNFVYQLIIVILNQ